MAAQVILRELNELGRRFCASSGEDLGVYVAAEVLDTDVVETGIARDWAPSDKHRRPSPRMELPERLVRELAPSSALGWWAVARLLRAA